MSHRKIPGHFEEQFQDTYGHPIRPGNLQQELEEAMEAKPMNLVKWLQMDLQENLLAWQNPNEVRLTA